MDKIHDINTQQLVDDYLSLFAFNSTELIKLFGLELQICHIPVGHLKQASFISEASFHLIVKYRKLENTAYIAELLRV